MSQTILIADDEQNIRSLIRKYAEFDGFNVVEAVDGMQALEIMNTHEIDLAVIDVMMPELDGFSLCREIKKNKPNVPLIILSARSEEYDRLHGFELGVDDYVVKPFSPKELIMRIHAVLNRVAFSANSAQTSSVVFRIDGLEINRSAHTVKIDSQNTNLSPREYDLLCYLIDNKGIALTREQILQNVWGYDYFGDDRTLDTHIKLLRRSLGEYGKKIVTVRGVGYRFDE